METTNLRQSDTTVRVTGVLAEKNLSVTTDMDGNKRIQGDVTIKTSSINSVQFRIFATEKTKKGQPNPAWNSVSALMNEYSSVADVGEENATIVRITGGRFDPQSFWTKGGQWIENAPRYSASFFNRLDRADVKKEGEEEVEGEQKKIRFQANMDVEAYVANIIPEIKSVNGEGEETGRKICNVWVNTYQGLEKASFIVPQEFASDFESKILPGQTRVFYIDIVNTEDRRIVEHQVDIGKPRIEEVIVRNRELLLTGASADYATSNDPALMAKVFPADAIQIGIREFEQRKEEKRRKMEEDAPVQRAAAASSAPKW